MGERSRAVTSADARMGERSRAEASEDALMGERSRAVTSADALLGEWSRAVTSADAPASTAATSTLEQRSTDSVTARRILRDVTLAFAGADAHVYPHVEKNRHRRAQPVQTRRNEDSERG